MNRETVRELIRRLTQEQKQTNELLQFIISSMEQEMNHHKKVKKEISFYDIPQAKPYHYNEKTEEMIKLFIFELFLEKKVNARVASSLLKDLTKEVEEKASLLEENYFNRKEMGLYQSNTRVSK